MLEDKTRWNKKYSQKQPMPNSVAPIVEKYSHSASQKGKALDIATGTGRNARYLASLGFEVDAVDISDVALQSLQGYQNINVIEADLDSYCLQESRYDIIVKCNFLDRRLFAKMKKALNCGGIVIVETFLDAKGEGYHQPSCSDYLLQSNELLHAFLTLEILFYEEKDAKNLKNEKVKIASLAARKPL